MQHFIEHTLKKPEETGNMIFFGWGGLFFLLDDFSLFFLDFYFRVLNNCEFCMLTSMYSPLSFSRNSSQVGELRVIVGFVPLGWVLLSQLWRVSFSTWCSK